MWMGVIGIAGATEVLQASTLIIARDVYVNYTGSISPTDVDVSGTLRVNGLSYFGPYTLDIFDGGGVNPAAPSGEQNGDVYFDSGTFWMQYITLSGPVARLFVNTMVYAESVTNNEMDVYVNDAFNVQGTIGIYTTSGRTSISSTGNLRAGTFQQDGSLASLQGEGQVWADTFNFGANPGQIEPGIGGSDPGNLTLKSANTIDLNGADLILDFDPLSGSDKLTIDGDIVGNVDLLPLFVYSDPSDLSSHGPFVFLTADTMSATFTLLDPSYTEVYDNDLNLVGHMILKTNSTSAWFEYQPVPEPVLGLLMASGMWAGLRRRRS